MVLLLIVSHSYGNINLAECAISDMHLVCFNHLQKNMFQPFLYKSVGFPCFLVLLISFCICSDFFFSVEDEKGHFYVN